MIVKSKLNIKLNKNTLLYPVAYSMITKYMHMIEISFKQLLCTLQQSNALPVALGD